MKGSDLDLLLLLLPLSRQARTFRRCHNNHPLRRPPADRLTPLQMLLRLLQKVDHGLLITSAVFAKRKSARETLERARER